MTILDFQDHIAQSTLQKGSDYFRRNKVSELVVFFDHWDAYVQGREQYLVNISLQGKFVTHTSCDCRVFNHEDHCKHVVAVLYSIHEKLFHPADTTVTPYILSLINALPAEDLRLYILELVHDSDYFTKDLLTFAEKSIELAAVIKYTGVLNNAFSHVANIEDYPSGEPGTLAAKPAARLLKQAKTIYREGDVTTAMDIAFAVISKKESFDNCGEDESGAYEIQVADAFHLLDDICSNTVLDEYNTRRIMRRSLEGFRSQEMDINRYDIHWLDLLLRHGWDEAEKDNLLDLLERLMETAKKERSGEAYKRYADAKQAIMDGTYRVKKIIKPATGMPASTEQALKILPPQPPAQAPAAKAGKKPAPLSEKKLAYLEKKAALLSELETEKASGTKIKYHALQKEMISIMQQNSDIFGVREMGSLFFEETGDQFFYDSVKNTYMLAEWEKLIAAKKG